MPEETQEEMMERIKKMSPEELQEFQKSRCIFCHIVEGKVPSKKVYEDDKVIAILDINPATQGHILVMTKEHYSIMPQIPREISDHLFVVTKKLSQVALQALGAKGTNVLIQNGPAAGQKAQHFMLHIIPRYDEKELNLELKRQNISDNDYNTIKERLISRVNSLMGMNTEAKKVDEVIEQGNNAVNEKKSELKEELVQNENIEEKPVQENVTQNNVEEQSLSQENVEQNNEDINQSSQINQSSEKVKIKENTLQKEDVEQKNIESSKLIDMGAVNNFLKKTNQEIDELQDTVKPENLKISKTEDHNKKDDEDSDIDLDTIAKTLGM